MFNLFARRKAKGKVNTYKNAGADGIFSEIKLSNGEIVLISFAGDEVAIFKLKASGQLPIETVWDFQGFYEFAKLIRDNGYSGQALDFLVERVLNCEAVPDIKRNLDELLK